MKRLTDVQKKDLCLSLLHADTEKEVEKILRKQDLWYHEENWRLLGDSPANWSVAGNQQAKPVPSLVEKLVNSIDAVLISKCIENGIEPKSEQAPENMYAAVEKFFNVPNGLLEYESNRSLLAQNIQLICTGLPKHEPCYTIADSGEGQTPGKIHSTILSLPGTKNPNKKGVPFVQGIFNMGGTGVIRFCGEQSIQLIISKRNPKLLPASPNNKDTLWSFTILRRRSPTKGRQSSYVEYLAPVNVSGRELNDTLTFPAASLPLLPKTYDKNAKNNAEHAYTKPMSYGTIIKLYEYKNLRFRANIQLDLNYELSRHFFRMGLPIRLSERRLRGYLGKTFSGHSFDTTLAGMKVRLQDNKSNLIQEEFSGAINVPNIGELDVTVHVLQNFIRKGSDGKMKDNRGNYHGGAEIQVIVNGQQHGIIPKALLSRKTVGLDHIESKLFIILDATKITTRAKELLFMASRDRLADGKEKAALEDGLITFLKDLEPLHQLNEEEKQKALEKAMKDTSSLEEVFQKLVKHDPVLAQLFPQLGPVIKPQGFKWEKHDGTYVGKKIPTFFRLKDGKKEFNLKCPINKTVKIIFEHDAVNDYFRRVVRPAKLKISIYNKKKREYVAKQILLKSMSTAYGITNARLQPLPESKPGESFRVKIELIDKKFADETIFKGKLRFLKNLPKNITKNCSCECHDSGATSCEKCIDNHKPKKPKTSYTRTKQPIVGEGRGGMSLPKIIPVKENDDNWVKLGFTTSTGMKIKVDNDFLVYVNMNNQSLTKELEGEKEPEFLAKLYQSAMSFLAVGMYHKMEQQQKIESGRDNEKSLDDKVSDAAEGIAMVLLPIITKLGEQTRRVKSNDA